VVELANRAGMNLRIQPTPSVALGSYEVTPIEIAAAYTVFANQGVYSKPNWVSMVRAEDGSVMYTHKQEQRPVLDPRISYMMVNLLEEVMRSGTAAGVRARGFSVPAGGKTGTSDHDGWFAGFTSELICAVWVGFDDNRELNLEGARSALPIWTEFMKRALKFREYRNAKPFDPPDGILALEIDPLSGQLATPSCPSTRREVFIGGTQPVEACRLHGAATTVVAGWETAPPPLAEPSPPSVTGSAVAQHRPPPTAEVANPPDQPLAEAQPVPQKRKKGILRRLWGIFK
jgi:penicillin-binding protein 1B